MQKYYERFETSGLFTKKQKLEIRPYLLSPLHPLRPILDKLFKTRITQNKEAFEKAGFETHFTRPRSFITVASHQKMPGYLIKAYLDTEPRSRHKVPGWLWFSRRVEGAERIRHVIQKYNLKHFTVPNKWIYPLSVRGDKKQATNVVLIVQKMNLVSSKENRKAWKEKMTKEHLDELFIIISEARGSRYRHDNLAYTKEGKFAFIDTEHPEAPSDFNSTAKELSGELLEYWNTLIQTKRHTRR